MQELVATKLVLNERICCEGANKMRAVKSVREFLFALQLAMARSGTHFDIFCWRVPRYIHGLSTVRPSFEHHDSVFRHFFKALKLV
jgi:hypothetical protein